MENVCAKFLNQYDNFSFLWEKELDVVFKEFLDTGKDIRETFEENLLKEIEDNGWEKEDPKIEAARENFETMIKKIYKGVATRQPALEKFDEKILHLTEIKQQIKSMETTNNVGWLKVDS